MMKKIYLPLTDKDIRSLTVREKVLLNGVMYTARDAAHKRMVQSIKDHKDLPFEIEGQVIYYTGPTPVPTKVRDFASSISPGRIIGSCGPTTSHRMDIYTPYLLKLGIRGMIGKGWRSEGVIKAIKNYRAIYFIAIGGAGAFYSERIKSTGVIAYKDLGPEAIYRLEVEDFPVIVGVDSQGKSI